MNSDQTQAHEALQRYMNEMILSIPETIQWRMINSKLTRKTIIEFSRHLDTIDFYQKHIPQTMLRLNTEYMTTSNKDFFTLGAKAQDYVHALSKGYRQLENASKKLKELDEELMLEVEHLSINHQQQE
tara:strand:- start:5603 stop:5986 length:384 start_codon:yes stop_codon:yes gene_type:complete